MLNKQLVALNLAGIDTKSDQKQLAPGKLQELENGIFSTTKSIRKRNGYDKHNYVTYTAATLTYNLIPTVLNAGKLAAKYNTELFLTDGKCGYSVSQSTNKAVYKGRVSSIKPSETKIIQDNISKSYPDTATTANGVQIIAYEQTGVYYSLVDSATKQVLDIKYTSSTCSRPRTTTIDNTAILVYADSSNNSLNFIRGTSSGIGTPVSLLTDLNATHPNYDITVSSGNLYVAYNSAAGGIKIIIVSPYGLVGNGVSKASESATNSISIHTDDETYIWVCYNNATNNKFFVMSNNLVTTVLAATTIAAAASVNNVTSTYIGNETSVLFYDVLGSSDGAGNYPNATTLYSTFKSTGTIVSTAQAFRRSVMLLSKAQNINFIPYVIVGHSSALQPSGYLMSIYNTSGANDGAIVSKCLSGLLGGIATKSLLPSLNYDGTSLSSAQLFKESIWTTAGTGGNTVQFSTAGITQVSFDMTVNNTAVQIGNNLILSNLPSLYDGKAVTEYGYHLYPEGVTATVATTGGSIGNGTAGSFAYQVIYEWYDAKGQVHRSSPSPILTKTSGATSTNAITLTIPTLRLTDKTNVNIVVYRTKQNGTTYFRVNLPSSPLANTIAADTVTYVDIIADADLTANEQLYTLGELENITCPSTTIMTTYKNRLLAVPSNDLSSFWFSKQVVPGFPPEFNDAFQQSIGTFAGDLTGMLQMDDKLILFTNYNIFLMYGDGPSASGANNDFSTPQMISTDVGCVDQASIVLTQDGIMFKSHKGIYVLGRNLQPSYIGKDVEAYNSNTVTSAILDSTQNMVLFYLDSGIALVYHYLYGQWGTFTNHSANSACIFNDKKAFIKSDGSVWLENSSVFKDGPLYVALKIKTGWLNFATLSGYQRVYKTMLLGDFKGNHRLNIDVAYDYDSSVTQNLQIQTDNLNLTTWGSDSVYGNSSPYGGGTNLYQYRINIQRQKCQAIQFSFYDLISNTPSEAWDISSLTFEVGGKTGFNKLGKANSIG